MFKILQSCEIFSQVLYSNVHFIFIIAIPVVTVAQSNYPVGYGNSVQLVCTVTATPTHSQVYWTKLQSGQEVTINTANSAKYSGSTVNNPSLTINNADLSDETFYVCKASNSVGLGQSQQTYVDVSGSMIMFYSLRLFYYSSTR